MAWAVPARWIGNADPPADSLTHFSPSYFHPVTQEGQKDHYTPDKNGVVVTSAQGEGAIEGTFHDYTGSE